MHPLTRQVFRSLKKLGARNVTLTASTSQQAHHVELSEGNGRLPLTVLTEDEAMMKETVSKLAKEQIGPYVRQMESEGKVTDSVLKTLFENGRENPPTLSRSASDDKSDDYMNADDNTHTNTNDSVTKPSEGVYPSDPMGNPNQPVNKQLPARNSTPSGPSDPMPNFQSAYTAESKHLTKITIKSIEMPTGTRARVLDFGPGTVLHTVRISQGNTGAIPKIFRSRIKSLENIKINNYADIPITVQQTIHNFNTGEYTSEEEQGAWGPNPMGNWLLPTSPNSTWNLWDNSLPQSMDIDKPPSQTSQNELLFETPRKFSSNFQRLIREKSKLTLTTTSNKFKPLTDDSDLDDEIGKIVKRKRKNTPKDAIPNNKATEKQATNVPAPVQTKKMPPARATQANNTKKSSMSPIVVDGKTVNQSALIQDLKAKIKGGFSVKHTNNSTILFVGDKEDHLRVLQSVKDENIAHHTYTNNDDKSHAFVLRGLADGAKTQDIEDDLVAEYDKDKKHIPYEH
ncbi:unnamed protein product [Psylliodes chrysocephalus]|uniref:Uncharacterized protein n=1 Tax=Psylliodes chrysocephalus TaxID=3402493 RepID=A0A9P0D2E7_9CUCU|nr:unnamed protein product [Psylliodes chrysocephala]